MAAPPRMKSAIVGRGFARGVPARAALCFEHRTYPLYRLKRASYICYIREHCIKPKEDKKPTGPLPFMAVCTSPEADGGDDDPDHQRDQVDNAHRS